MPDPSPAGRPSIGISQLAYQLPSQVCSLEVLQQQGELVSSAVTLRGFGFKRCYRYRDHDEFVGAQVNAGQAVLQRSGIMPERIATLFVYSAFPDVPRPTAITPADTLALFQYPAGQLHQALGLPATTRAVAVTQQGCGGLPALIEIAGSILQSSPAPSAVLCLAGERLPAGARREILYNVISDGAGAVLVERDSPRNRVLASVQHTQSYYWDTPRREAELLAAYFPMAQRVITAALAKAGISLAEVRWFVPHNVSWRSWQILAQLLTLPEEKIWHHNIGRVGHTISCDHIINLVDMATSGAVHPGDRLVLFTFGFGANWSCQVVQH